MVAVKAVAALLSAVLLGGGLMTAAKVREKKAEAELDEKVLAMFSSMSPASSSSVRAAMGVPDKAFDAAVLRLCLRKKLIKAGGVYTVSER